MHSLFGQFVSKSIIAVAGLLLLAACAQPVAQTPTLTQEEIERERAEQRAFIKNSDNATAYDTKTYSKEDQESMEHTLQAIVGKLAPEATKLCREMNGPEANCDLRVDLAEKGKGVNAHADGEKIVVYPAMVDFAQNETHMAMVLAHEYTHHMMGHVQSTKSNVMGGALIGTLADMLAASQGANTQGQFGKMGANAALLSYSPDFEYEADYIGLYILARAGYPIEEASEFWRLMARYNPQGIYNRTTHPTTPERFVMLEKTVAEIKDKKAKGQRMLPNLLPEEG
jgi:predicted Zn-dependent protease